jgi:hypothetical protein
MRLTCQVIERILADPRLEAERITVEVQNGVVNLFGSVSTFYARVVAADLARSTPGVLDICNRLELARTADLTDGLPDLWPDPFDELVAHWNIEQQATSLSTGRRVKANLLTAAAALATIGAALLWLVLLPRFGGAGLIIVLPCAGAAVALAILAGRERMSSGDGDPPPSQEPSS